jgi:3-deoxy-7-phosphoheptulonate synthase
MLIITTLTQVDMKDRNTQEFNIVGPCSMESKEQIESVFEVAMKCGLTYIRTQVYKPRTNPNSFQGMADEGIAILKELRSIYSSDSIKYVLEVCSKEHFDSVKDIASIIQIGARNMQNFELLKYVARNFTNDYVLLKRGFSNTLEEWISSAEYLISGGIPKDKIILCERGSRSFTSPTGVSLDFINAMMAKEAGFKVIIDPSHGSKEARFVLPLARAAQSMDFDGLMIEAHPNPSESVSDRAQAISLEDLESFFNF